MLIQFVQTTFVSFSYNIPLLNVEQYLSDFKVILNEVQNCRSHTYAEVKLMHHQTFRYSILQIIIFVRFQTIMCFWVLARKRYKRGKICWSITKSEILEARFEFPIWFQTNRNNKVRRGTAEILIHFVNFLFCRLLVKSWSQFFGMWMELCWLFF